MRVLVTGGKGDLGRRLVPLLEAAGHDLVVGTRRPSSDKEVHYDLKAEPSPALLEEVDVLVHLASDATHPDDDIVGSSRLWEAARKAELAHTIYMSIVGIDDHPFRYYRAKLEAEESLLDSGIPHTVQRATQFHGLVPRFVDEIGGRLRVVPVPGGIPLQPVDTDLVAGRLAERVEKGPSGRARDLAGPEVLSLDDMVSVYLGVTGRRRPQLRLPMWGKAVAGFRKGLQLAGPEAEVGGRTYREYLEAS